MSLEIGRESASPGHFTDEIAECPKRSAQHVQVPISCSRCLEREDAGSIPAPSCFESAFHSRHRVISALSIEKGLSIPAPGPLIIGSR